MSLEELLAAGDATARSHTSMLLQPQIADSQGYGILQSSVGSKGIGDLSGITALPRLSSLTSLARSRPWLD